MFYLLTLLTEEGTDSGRMNKTTKSYVDVVALAVQVSSHLLACLIPLLFTQRLVGHLAAVGQRVMHRQLSLQQYQLLLQVLHLYLAKSPK